jgi:tetratricopeptide (TPR) repeat protein
MSAENPPVLELIARRMLPTAVRATTLGGESLSYRRSLTDVIPGQLLTVREQRRWVFRTRTMVGGPLLHVGFSLRALRSAGIALPERDPSGHLVDVAAGDTRIEEGLHHVEFDDWLSARVSLLALLEHEPGSLVAQSALGITHAALRQTVVALAHHTAAIRLGFAALGASPSNFDPERPPEAALLDSLAGRATLLERLGRPESAAADLRRALRCDPEDRLALGQRLAAIARKLQEAAGPQTC